MRPIPPLAVFTLFAVGLEAIVGLSLGLSNGLSETHKSVLVGFIVGFPALTLFFMISLLGRSDRDEAVKTPTPMNAPFRGRSSDLAAEPFAAGVNRG